MVHNFPRGFELTTQILSEQPALDLVHFNGWNKLQIDQLSFHLKVKSSIGWEGSICLYCSLDVDK